MRVSLNFISLLFFILTNINISNASITFINASKKFKTSNDLHLVNDTKIGISSLFNEIPIIPMKFHKIIGIPKETPIFQFLDVFFISR